jgi:hypothetical protein
MEKACARAFSTHSGHYTTESSIQQSENIVLNMCVPHPFISFTLLANESKGYSPPIYVYRSVTASMCL